MCLRICTGFKEVSFRETHLREHFGRTDQIALITCLKKLNVLGALLVNGIQNPLKWGFSELIPDSFPASREPHFLWFGLPQPLLN